MLVCQVEHSQFDSWLISFVEGANPEFIAAAVFAAAVRLGVDPVEILRLSKELRHERLDPFRN